MKRITYRELKNILREHNKTHNWDDSIKGVVVFTIGSFEEVLSCCYTGKDFLDEFDGDAVLAERLFWYCDWQHPSSAACEIEDEEDET